MTPLNGPTLYALEQLRRQSALTVSLADAVLFGQRSLARNAMRPLIPALQDLIVRAQRTIAALEQEEPLRP
jgi:hypothetical protein